MCTRNFCSEIIGGIKIVCFVVKSALLRSRFYGTMYELFN